MEFKRPPIFYSVFAAIYDLLYGLPPNTHDSGTNDFRPNLKEGEELALVKGELFRLNEALVSNTIKDDEDEDEEFSLDDDTKNEEWVIVPPEEIPEQYKEFIDASKSSTDKLPSRQIRHTVLKNIFSICFL